MSTVGYVSCEPVTPGVNVTLREPCVQRLQFGLVSSHCPRMSMDGGTYAIPYLDFFEATRQAASGGATVLGALALARL